MSHSNRCTFIFDFNVYVITCIVFYLKEIYGQIAHRSLSDKICTFRTIIIILGIMSKYLKALERSYLPLPH